ncbi:MAG: nucleoside-diphosphate kinase [Candidatus Burarchaeum sp.]|nr:nucleoside-diphosphate kinase [Candidatus Burarchaeum sp.]MDO8340042.1 nucleoside-diphosphate kinase [Candidatus Burarchaeum sp.]
MAIERTLIILKPDCVKKKLAGEVLKRFEQTEGLRIAGLKMKKLNKKILEEHYAHHKDKPFFKALCKFMKSSPVVFSVIEGENAVARVRDMCGPTDSKQAPKGTIRGDLGEDVQMNVIHASDSVETANVEIPRFFKKSELF